jgi:hypothetical protein
MMSLPAAAVPDCSIVLLDWNWLHVAPRGPAACVAEHAASADAHRSVARIVQVAMVPPPGTGGRDH